MSFETYTKIYDGGEEGITLRPMGKGAEFSFSLTPKTETRYRLFTTGETEQYYMWKDEPDGPQLYRTLTDALDSKHAIRDRFCLNLSCKKYETYLKRIYKKIAWPPMLSYLKMAYVPTEWEAGVTVSTKNLTFAEGGYLQMRMDVRLRHEGVDPRSVTNAPDKRIVIPFPEGSYTGLRLCEALELPADTAHVCVFVEGKGYKGECYIEQPFLSGAGQNLLPSFNEAAPANQKFEWLGQYLSRKEWPEFRVRLNGKVIYTGEIFERSHRHSEWEITLPTKYLQEQNTVSYELISDYHDPLPYTLYEVSILEQPAAPLSVIAVTEAAPAGGKARVLVRTERANLRVKLSCPDSNLSGKEEWFFREPGLHGMLLDCGEPCENATFRLIWEDGEAEGTVKRIVRRVEDRVVTGTGDMIYICQEQEQMDEYLSWYLSNHVGDFLTIRPAYRWSGTRTLNQEVWKKFRRLMKELDLKYVLIRDGREVEGLSAQPDAEMLRGKGFYGIQMHELDNMHYYGGMSYPITTLYGEMDRDMFRFAYLEDPEHTRSSQGIKDSRMYTPDGKMMVGFARSMDWSYSRHHTEAVASLKDMRRESDTRHTGPSALFRTFKEAGFSWMGAETMYNSMEPLMGFLRGVAKEFSMPTYGVHHAVQWSTTPHESEARYRRYRLALYASYLLGATDINTEEGLWHLEEYYEHHHRFSRACLGHLKQQQDFYRYVSTHTRSGAFYSPVALMHGRDDGTTFFGKDRTWGRRPEKQTPAEDGWDLLTVLYPECKPVDRMYIHNCPDDKPQGYHSGTPYGNVDAISAEAKLAVWKAYRAMIFLGYNRCTAEDAGQMIAYARQGGTLLLSRAHLTVTDTVPELKAGNLVFERNAMSFCDGQPEFGNKTVGGVTASVCVNAKTPDEVLATTDDGTPLVCLYRVGKGKILLFNTKEYPAHAAIRPFYEAEMKKLLEDEAAKETVWAEGADNVEFASYDQKDGTRHLYFLATDWYRDPAPLRRATVRVGEDRYDLTLPFGTLIKCVSDGTCAAWPENEDGEVLSVKDGVVTVQGTGRVSFVVAKDGKQTVKVVDFSKASVQAIS